VLVLSYVKALLLNDTRNESHIGCDVSVSQLISYCKDVGIKIVSTFNRSQPLILPKDVEFIIINGEGTFHHSPVYFQKIVSFVSSSGLPAVILNAVWHHVFTDIDFSCFKLIAFRDPFSMEDFKRSYPSFQGELFLGADFLFLFNEKQQKIGYGDSVMPLLASSLKKNNFFPLQFVASYPDIYAYLGWLRSLDLYVTGRFHGVVLSVLAQTPFLVFPSNCHKIEGLLNDMGCSDLLIHSFEEIPKKKTLATSCVGKMKEYRNIAKNRLVALKDRLKALLK